MGDHYQFICTKLCVRDAISKINKKTKFLRRREPPSAERHARWCERGLIATYSIAVNIAFYLIKMSYSGILIDIAIPSLISVISDKASNKRLALSFVLPL